MQATGGVGTAECKPLFEPVAHFARVAHPACAVACLPQYEGTNPPAHMILAAGMCSSSIAQFAAYPLALTRTRLQVGLRAAAAAASLAVGWMSGFVF